MAASITAREVNALALEDGRPSQHSELPAQHSEVESSAVAREVAYSSVAVALFYDTPPVEESFPKPSFAHPPSALTDDPEVHLDAFVLGLTYLRLYNLLTYS